MKVHNYNTKLVQEQLFMLPGLILNTSMAHGKQLIDGNRKSVIISICGR
jgi:hypothetical protein